MATYSIFLPGKSHGQKSLAAVHGGRKESDTTELLTPSLYLPRWLLLGRFYFKLIYFLAALGFSLLWLLLWSTGSGARAQLLWCTDLVAPWYMGSSLLHGLFSSCRYRLLIAVASLVAEHRL